MAYPRCGAGLTIACFFVMLPACACAIPFRSMQIGSFCWLSLCCSIAAFFIYPRCGAGLTIASFSFMLPACARLIPMCCWVDVCFILASLLCCSSVTCRLALFSGCFFLFNNLFFGLSSVWCWVDDRVLFRHVARLRMCDPSP